MEFVLLFALFFVVGFIVRGIYRLTTTKRCPYCMTQIDKYAIVCKACGRDVYDDDDEDEDDDLDDDEAEDEEEG